jgi:hypothetical protein
MKFSNAKFAIQGLKRLDGFVSNLQMKRKSRKTQSFYTNKFLTILNKNILIAAILLPLIKSVLNESAVFLAVIEKCLRNICLPN